MAEETGHILIVDDNKLNRMKLGRALEQLGHTHEEAEDGRQGLDMLRAKPFDLMLLDLLMPEMDGHEVLEHVKADEALREIPVVVISADDEMDTVVECIEKGAEDLLPKQFSPVLLKARIQACLERKRLREEVRELRAKLQELE